MLSPRAVSAVACGVIIPGLIAGTSWAMRAAWRWIETVGRAEDIDDTQTPATVGGHTQEE